MQNDTESYPKQQIENIWRSLTQTLNMVNFSRPSHRLTRKISYVALPSHQICAQNPVNV